MNIQSVTLGVKSQGKIPLKLKSVKGRTPQGGRNPFVVYKQSSTSALQCVSRPWCRRREPTQPLQSRYALPGPCNYLLIWRWTTSLHPLETPIYMEMHKSQVRDSGNIAILPTAHPSRNLVLQSYSFPHFHSGPCVRKLEHYNQTNNIQ